MAARTAEIRSFVFRHPVPIALAALVALAAGIFVIAYFEPHKLFIDQRIDEAGPTPAAGQTAGPSEPAAGPPAAGVAGEAAPAAPRTLARAAFRNLEHTTTGEAVVTELPDGSRILRLEGFETSNGPDLRVYLSGGSSDAGFGKEYGRDFVELGVLKGNIGNQNYEIPAGVDLARYRNAVIWCKRFSVGFGVATLSV